MGAKDYTVCPECESILSPAAYLVDLLHNVLDAAPANLLFSVLGVLGNRRPDLLFLRLDCQNAEQQIPYIDLINEVLEACVVYKLSLPHELASPFDALPNDSSPDATVDELAVNPENTNPEAYKPLLDAVYPRNLPFNPWLETMRAYLGSLGLSRHELLLVFGAPASASDVLVACERLGVSAQERDILSTADAAGIPRADPHPVNDYFGGIGGFMFPLFGIMQPVENFLRFAGLEYAQLLQLFRTRFVNPAGLAPANRLAVETTDPSSLAAANVTGLANDARLAPIHRFLRLWRKLGWGMFDLDRFLHAFGAADIDDGLLIKLADALGLSKRLNLPVARLLPLWANLDAHRYDDELDPYRTLFQNRAVTNPIDPCFALADPPAPLEVAGMPSCVMAISAHLPAIQAALRLPERDVAALAAGALPDDLLNLANLSALYRHALLARALRVTAADLLSLRALHGADPFASPRATADFVAFADSVREAGFTVGRLEYLYRDRPPAGQALAPTVRDLANLSTELSDGLARIAADNVLSADPNGELMRKKLTLIYDAPTAEIIVSLILGTSVWRAPLTAMPALVVSDDLKAKLLFSAKAAALQFTGAMSTAERDALTLGQPAVFQTAVQSLWQQPRSFIDATLASFPTSDGGLVEPFLNATAAKTTLLDPAVAPADKAAFVLPPLLKHLVDTLSRDLATRSLAATFKVEPPLARWLLETGLRSRADATDPAMDDFLGTHGVDAAYFSGGGLGGKALLRRETAVTFDWGVGSPDPSIAHASFSAQWTGLLIAPASETFTLSALANDGVRLWIEDRLLIDDWADRPATERSAAIQLKAGRAYPFTLQYRQATAAAPAITLSWSSASIAKAAIPASALRGLDHWRLFHKAAMLIGALKLSAAELGYLIAHSADFGGLDLNRLPLHPSAFDPAVFATWRRMGAVARLRAKLTLGGGRVADVFGAPSRAEAIAKLAAGAGWDPGQLDWLAGPAAMNLADANFRNEVRLLQLADCFDLARRAGASVQALRRWAVADMAGPDAPDVATEIRQSVKAQYDDPTWITVGKGLNDPLREARRVALVSYLLAHPDLVNPADTDVVHPILKTPDDLYEYLLIDVQMDACMITSRIKQAISTVQLFVQRCLLGLEPDVPVGALSADHWRNIQSFRVWQAGRQVFMYPENWIEPQLRDDKTPFFKDLETELQKAELTAENVEAAYVRYLHKLEAIARPQIVGMFVETADDPGIASFKRVVHVVARTRSKPKLYYYRRQEGGLWTAWEPVTLDFEGDWVLPLVWERRLYLFWPVMAEKAAPVQASGGSPSKYWEIRLAYSERRQGTWTPKRMLDAAVNIQLNPLALLIEKTLLPDNFSFKGLVSNDRLVVQVFVFVHEIIGTPAFTTHRELVAEVEVSLCDGETRVSHASSSVSTKPVFIPGEIGPDSTGDVGELSVPFYTASDVLDLRFNGWNWRSGPTVLGVQFGDFGDQPVRPPGAGQSELVLDMVAKPFEMVVPHQYRQFVQQAPYFFQDRENTYFVEPTLEWISDWGVYRLHVRFFNHYDEFVCYFLMQLQRGGLDALLDLRTQLPAPGAPLNLIFGGYAPDTSVVDEPLPENIVEFASDSAYAIYHWELFFHAPFLIACKLSQDQRFADAMRWFHYIFNPTQRRNEPEPQRFWNFLPFHENDPTDPQNAAIQNLLLALDDASNPALSKQVRDQLHAWADQPFNPHRIARVRPVAYQNAVVMKYVDNLIAWGDQLFGRDTIESINEATQLYILAAKVLGEKPRALEPLLKPPPLTFVKLGAIGEFANALEDALPVSAPSAGGGAVTTGAGGGLGLALMPYFCIPPNAKLLGYWDTIADRLYKIRHCQNIEGVVRQLPLYEPPIDPGLLVRAAALGVDVSSLLSDLASPAPYYRFTVVLQKAFELCGYLKGLGAELIAALEKSDAEQLASLRAGHESALLDLVKTVKQSQLQEVQRLREGLDKTAELIQHRRQFYAAQLAENGNGLTGHEKEHQDQLSKAQDWQAAAQMVEAAAGAAFAFPDLAWGTAGMSGSPVVVAKLGGSTAGAALHAAGNVLDYLASVHTFWANEAGVQAEWERRARGWALEVESATIELAQIEKQQLAADIRIDIAGQEIANLDQQRTDAREIEAFYRDKYTNQELYDWMASEVSALYFQGYQVAYNLAKRAERAYRFERGLTQSDFIQFGYWDNLKKGLLSAERLELSLRRLEHAYLEENRREFEITKHVSLQLLDPIALVALKQSGRCEVVLPERLFDADYPGHYMRRLKSVSMTLPCVVGPYTSINCTLTMLNNTTRVKSTPATPYAQSADEADPRFVSNFAAIQSIATSHGQNDSGMFELNFRDERYLPFEGAGAISRWRIELPAETNAFDPATLTDVVLHLKYWASDGGAQLREAALAAARGELADPDSASLMRLVSARHEYPEAWRRFGRPADPAATSQVLELDLSRERFPYSVNGRTLTAARLSVFLIFKDPQAGAAAYQSAARLHFTIQSDGGAALPLAELVSSPGFLRGTPRGVVEFAPPLELPAKLSLTLAEADVAQIAAELREKILSPSGEHVRLKMNMLEDLILVIHYAAA